MFPSSIPSADRWFAGLVTVYILGNLGAYFLSLYMVNVHLGLVHLVPWLFLIVPGAGALMCAKGKLLNRTYRFRNGVIGLLIIVIGTWLGVTYVYLKNAFPNTF